MKVRMAVTLSGRDALYAGQEYDVEDGLGEALCHDGRAIAVDAPRRNAKRAKPGADDVEER